MIDGIMFLNGLINHSAKNQKKLNIKLKNDNGFIFTFTIVYSDLYKNYYIDVFSKIRDKSWFYTAYSNIESRYSVYNILENFINIHKVNIIDIYYE